MRERVIAGAEVTLMKLTLEQAHWAKRDLVDSNVLIEKLAGIALCGRPGS